MSLFSKLKRHNVFRVGIVYVLAYGIVEHITHLVAEVLELPAWGSRLILLLLVVGLVPVLIDLELTPEGPKREKDAHRRTARRLDFVIMGLAVVTLGYVVWESIR